jgi:hypothetical protein
MADTEVAVPLDPSTIPTTLVVDATPVVKESYALESEFI